jgi:hypothetical protein
MLHVYRNSVCNIAAADSNDVEGGIFRKRDPVKLLDAELQGHPDSTIFGNSIWRVVPKLLWEREVVNAALNIRGWVFQGKYSDSSPTRSYPCSTPYCTSSSEHYPESELYPETDISGRK